MILSLFNFASNDIVWLSAIILLMAVYVLKHKKEVPEIIQITEPAEDPKPEKENLIDCYHILSRKMYVTEKTHRCLSQEETEQVYNRRNEMIRIRWVGVEEKVHSNIWGDEKQYIVYGTLFTNPL